MEILALGAKKVSLADDDNNESVKFKINKENNELLMSWNRPAKPITLASDAFHGETYTDLFVTRNLKTNSHFNTDLTGYTLVSGTPTASSDDYNTPGRSMKCFGATSQYVTASVSCTVGATLYVAVKAKVIRYISGGGLGFYGNQGDYDSPMRLTEVTSDFVTMSHIFVADGTTFTVSLGSMESANLDGYVDDYIVIDISDLLKYNQTSKDLDALYDNYLNILKGNATTVQETKKYKLVSKENWTCSAPEAEAEFIRKMREKALA